MPRIFGQWEGVADPIHVNLPGPAASIEYCSGGRLWYTMPDGSVPDTLFEDISPYIQAVTLVGPPDMPTTETHLFDSRLPYVLITWMGVAGGNKPIYVVKRNRLEELDDWLSAPAKTVTVGGVTTTIPSHYGTDAKNFVVLRTGLTCHSVDWQAV